MPVSAPSRRERIKSHQAPAAIGPYSQAVLVGNLLFCSGQLALHPESGVLLQTDIEQETTQVLDNLGAVLEGAGMSYEHVVRCTVYLTNMDDYAAVNDVYARYFSAAPPAREAVEVRRLPRGARIEISCIAAR